MRSENETTPLAWVWSQYNRTSGASEAEPPMAWVWSQYAASTVATQAASQTQASKKLESKYLYAAAAVALVILAAVYKESSEITAPHQPNNAEMAEAQIMKALGYLKEAYRISPRSETEKVITQVEKIQHP